MSVLPWGLAIATVTLLPARDATARPGISMETSPVDFLANVLLFVPAFAAIGARTPGVAWPMAWALATSASIEVLQLRIPGRETSPFDLLANLLGALLGLSMARSWRALSRPDLRARAGLTGLAVLAVGQLILDHLTARFVGTRPPYYALVAPRLGWLPHTTWEVGGVRLASHAPPGERLVGKLEAAARGPCAGGVLRAELLPGQRRTAGWAPLVLIADEHGEALSVLAEWNGALLLANRTAATTWGGGLAWHPIRTSLTPGLAHAVSVSCAADVMSWRLDGPSGVESGSHDLRFGHVIRTLTSRFLVPLHPALLHWPVVAAWCMLGALAGFWLPRNSGQPRRQGPPARLVALALLPGASAAVLARADARVAVLGWLASLLVCGAVTTWSSASRRAPDADRPADGS
jgi:hypothetical protein